MVIEDGVLDFLDGNLAPNEEEELLHRLAVSPERRALLKQHLHVRELTSALARKNRYTVPKTVTASLFETLSANGYAGPIFHSSSENAAMLRSSLEKNLDRSAATFVTKRKSMYLASVFSFVVGAVLMYLLLPGIASQTSDFSALEHTNTLKVNNSSSSSIVSASGTSLTNSNTGAVSEKAIEGLRISDQEHTATPARVSAIHSAAPVNTTSSVYSDVSRPLRADIVSSEEIAVKPSTLSIAAYSTTVRLGSSFAFMNSAVDKNISAEDKSTSSNVASSRVVSDNANSSKQMIDLNRELAIASTKSWWEDGGIRSGSISDIRSKGYFGRDRELESSASILDRTTASIRTGGGMLPDATRVTASLIEFKLSANLNDWIVGKLSFGQFMPYETEAQNAGKNIDGIRQLELVPVLQSKSVVGAEIGVCFDIIGAPIELMGGMITDMKNGVIPRASIFSHFELFENLDFGMGVEAVLYTNNISSSLADKQNIFSYEHPVLISQPKSEELSGFIGPAFELLWHF